MMNVKFLRAWNAKAIAAALCLVLAAVPLIACSGQQGAGSGNGSSAASSSAAASAGVPSWKTLGDALAERTESMASGWNSEYFVVMFYRGTSIFRVVAKIDPAINKKIEAVDWGQENAYAQIEAAASEAPLESVEDLTSELIPQAELDKLVGKTGRELMGEGWIFESYFMYGGEQTGAVFARGHLAYGLTFDVTVPDSSSDPRGDLLLDAKLVEAQFQGAANSAISPDQSDQNWNE